MNGNKNIFKASFFKIFYGNLYEESSFDLHVELAKI